MKAEKKVMRRADEENGCEHCWRRIQLEYPEVDKLFEKEPFGRHPIPISVWEEFKECPHNPPQYAPSIFTI